MNFPCDLSVILVSWNSRCVLTQCLTAIFSSTQRPVLEVILVDNASSDDTVAWCQAHWPQVKVVPLAENQGFSGGCNEGLKLASGRHVMLLNPDTIVQKDTLAVLVTCLEDHPEVAAVGPRLLNPDGSLQSSCRGFPTLWTEFCQAFYLSALWPKSRLFSGYYMAGWDHGFERDVDVVTGAALVIRREWLDKVGLLDAQMSFMFYEEIDWCLRLHKAGGRLVYLPEARILHVGGGSSAGAKSCLEGYRVDARFNYFRKHHGSGSVPLLWLVHGVSGVLFVMVLTVLVAMGVRHEKARRLREHYRDTLVALRGNLRGQRRIV